MQSTEEDPVSEPVPEADRLEQEVAVTDEVGPDAAPGAEADPVDAAEQAAAVPHDEDDDRR
ncbi:hypothetical protein GCM10011381_03440 [Klenkia taihuensis]|uniref:Uncharacterized protein n=1 Tax=Klenkia taihuensis TaxID=1225127 RepID=A0A1I1QY84_9ACTN|nr:hypothetical protein GCM10011381_03440 [Klenkia taihuensis]SFD26952.1 hypothetical protein SAMN05661030_3024 [Klenkia taihuensis]